MSTCSFRAAAMEDWTVCRLSGDTLEKLEKEGAA